MGLTIDEEKLGVLGSETRREILKKLEDHGKTPTYLSRELGKSKSTVVEHLSKLVSEGLVDKEKIEGRKRVVYSLSPRGGELVRPGRRISLVLAASILSLIGGSAALWKWFSSPVYVGTRMAQEAAEASGKTTTVSTQAQTSPNPWILVAGVVLFITGSLGMVYWARKR